SDWRPSLSPGRRVYIMRAFEALGEHVQIVIDDVERFERLDRLDHVVAVVAGSAMGLAHDVQLAVVRQPAGVLGMAAVDDVAERFAPALRWARQPGHAHHLPVYRGGLLALAQIFERGSAELCRDPIGDAAAGAAEVEA